MMNLVNTIIRMNSEDLTTELGKQPFIHVTTITTIAKIFATNLNDIDQKFQDLKDSKYKYEEFCDLCDEGKEDDNKLLSEVFEYTEIKEFAYSIINKIAEKLQERINNR